MGLVLPKAQGSVQSALNWVSYWLVVNLRNSFLFDIAGIFDSREVCLSHHHQRSSQSINGHRSQASLVLPDKERCHQPWHFRQCSQKSYYPKSWKGKFEDVKIIRKSKLQVTFQIYLKHCGRCSGLVVKVLDYGSSINLCSSARFFTFRWPLSTLNFWRGLPLVLSKHQLPRTVLFQEYAHLEYHTSRHTVLKYIAIHSKSTAKQNKQTLACNKI